MSDEFKAKGNAAFSAQNFPEAVEWFTKGIAVDEKNHVLYSNRSACFAKMQQYDKALEDAKKCVENKPDWAKGYNRLGAALFGLRQFSAAEDAYGQGLQYDPSMESLKSGLEQAKRAKAMPPHPLAQVFTPNLIALLATSTDPKLVELRGDKEFMGIVAQVVQDNSLINNYLQDPRMMTLLSAVIKRPGDEEEDVRPPPPKKEPEPPRELTPEELEAKKKHEEAEAFKKQGNDLYKQKKFEEAISFYEKALEVEPKNIQYMNNIAAVFLEQGKYQECCDQCDKVVDVGRENNLDFKDIAKAMTRKATCYHRQKDYDKAIACFKTSLLEHRNSDTLTKLQKCEAEKKKAEEEAYFSNELCEKARLEGNEKFKEQKYKEAIDLYNEASKRNPRAHAVYSNRAAALMKMGAYEDAERDCQKALKIEPKFVKAITRLAQIHFFKRDYHKALVEYRKGLDIDPNNEECKRGIEHTMMKVQESSHVGGDNDDERARRAMADPEIQQILSDTYMQQVLREITQDPKALSHYTSSKEVMGKIQKLIAAGIIKTA